MKDIERLLSQALQLPESDRAELAAQLLESLDPEDDQDAWAEEIERRCAASDAGTNVSSDGNDVRQRIELDIFAR